MDGTQDSSPSGLKKAFMRQNRSRVTQGQDLESNTSSSRSNGRASIDSTPEKRTSTNGEFTVEEPSSRFSKLMNNRRKKKNTANEKRPGSVASADSGLDSSVNGTSLSVHNENYVSGSSSANGSTNALDQSVGTVNLLTDDSEPDQTPPLLSRDSHSGYLTASSPLIKTTTVDEANEEHGEDSSIQSTSPTRRHSISAPEVPSGFLGVTSTTTISGPDSEAAKKRSVSPARRLKDALKPSQNKKSPSVSPDRGSLPSVEGQRKRGHSLLGGSSRRSSLSEKRSSKRPSSPPPPLPKSLSTNLIDPSTSVTGDVIDSKLPLTAEDSKVLTTVTPPTPTILSGEFPSHLTESPEAINPANSEFPPGTVVSPSGNMISHRRVRSAGAISHTPSKLSHITSLTPMAEEPRASNPRSPSSTQTGFFSSVFSAAQNAASTISNSLGAQNKNRNASQSAEPDKVQSESAGDQTEATEEGTKPEKLKELAIDTLGSGDLDFSHLDMDPGAGGVITTKDGVVITQPDVSAEPRASSIAARRDQMSARIEDSRAARAVSMAYEKSSDLPTTTTPSAPDEVNDVKFKSTTALSEITGEQTPPGGSIFEGDTGGSIKRTGSVRSRLARRHRGSSGATTSTIGAIGLSVGSLALPNSNSSVPRLTGFAVASKKRNRDYHQLFRSVPEDDFLIEDYSCALQRDIILAGRIYISEGHICFSSNILGWVTTLVISFDEIVAIEKENTAMVIPNAIAIQTLHARHTFRSLLSREATYDLMVNIWKINHPSLRSYLNGMRIDDGLGDKTEKANGSDVGSEVADEDEIYDEDEDNEGDSLVDGGDESINSSEHVETVKQFSRESTGLTTQATESSTALSTGDMKPNEKGSASPGDGNGFPGPAAHAPTEFNDPSGRFEKVVKEDIIPAPLGKIYSMVFGPSSGAFMSKFLVEDQKSMDLHFEDDRKGLNDTNKTRQYSYIKPLYSSIGPKQTKCISTETLDFLDLEKAVLVTLTTQTPDVPSGNVFSVKTKYLFTWAANNQTRFFMSCNIEWTGKSWLKGPIEKAAIDGQGTFGNDLVKALKTAVSTRATSTSKGAKTTKGRRKKGSISASKSAAAAAAASAALDANKRDHHGWGVFEPLHSTLSPVAGILKPLWSAHVAIGIIGFLLFTLYTKGLGTSKAVSPEMNLLRFTSSQRLAAYEEIWRAEENELWKWLEDRTGMDGINFPTSDQKHESDTRARRRSQKRHSQSIASQIHEEQISQREMTFAIQVVRDRLDKLEEVVSSRMDAPEP